MPSALISVFEKKMSALASRKLMRGLSNSSINEIVQARQWMSMYCADVDQRARWRARWRRGRKLEVEVLRARAALKQLSQSTPRRDPQLFHQVMVTVDP